MDAMPNNEHQGMVSRLTYVLQFVVVDSGLGQVLAGCNVSDRAKHWRENYRVPDVAVFLNGTKAIDKNSHWLGGPDLAIEIVSPRDRSRKKLDFYAAVGTRELLLIDRDPWKMELYRLIDQKLILVGQSTAETAATQESVTVPLAWRVRTGNERPMIEVALLDGSKHWNV